MYRKRTVLNSTVTNHIFKNVRRLTTTGKLGYIHINSTPCIGKDVGRTCSTGWEAVTSQYTKNTFTFLSVNSPVLPTVQFSEEMISSFI